MYETWLRVVISRFCTLWWSICWAWPMSCWTGSKFCILSSRWSGPVSQWFLLIIFSSMKQACCKRLVFETRQIPRVLNNNHLPGICLAKLSLLILTREFKAGSLTASQGCVPLRLRALDIINISQVAHIWRKIGRWLSEEHLKYKLRISSRTKIWKNVYFRQSWFPTWS